MKKLLPLNLQYFAVEEPSVEPTEPVEPTKTFTQAELDEIVTKRLERERKKFDKFADYDDLKAKASEYEQKLEEKRLAELSEQERLQEIAKKHEEEKQSLAQQLADLQAQNEREKITNEFIKAAPGVNIPTDRIDAALKLADLSAVKVGDNGVEGLDEVLNTLVDSYKFLAEVKKPQQPIGDPSNDGAGKDNTKTAEQQLKEAADKARKSGRQEDIAAYSKLKRELGL